MIVTMRHFRTIPNGGKTGYCTKGGRRFFDRYGLDWTEFVKNGLSEELFTETGDALAINLVKHAHNMDAIG